MRQFATWLIAIGMIATTAGAESTAPEGPTSVAVLALGTEFLVTWHAPDSDVDHYNVYGVIGSDYYYVDSTEDTFLYVSGNFATFAVSAVVGGVESEPTLADDGVCVKTSTSPPGVQVSKNCHGGTAFGFTYRPM